MTTLSTSFHLPSESESFQSYREKMKALCDSIRGNVAASAATCTSATTRATEAATRATEAATLATAAANIVISAADMIIRIAPDSIEATQAALTKIVAIEAAVRASAAAVQGVKFASIAHEGAERTGRLASEVESDPFDETDRKRAVYFMRYVFGKREVPTVDKPHPHCENCVVKVPAFDVSFLTPEDVLFAKEYKMRLKIAESSPEFPKALPITA
jgi:hypothetical protein